MRTALWVAACGALAMAAGIGAKIAYAQRIDPKRPRTLIVGAPPGAAPMERVDPRRTGLSRTPLPSGALRLAWRRNLGGLTIDHAPLVHANGEISIVMAHGDVITLDADGTEHAHVSVGSGALSGAVLLSDDTVLFLDGANEAVGVSASGIRFRTRLGGERGAAGAKLSPLALDDGGAVVAGASELTTLDAEGHVRARTAVREPLSGPLLVALGKIVAVAASGTVYTWSPATGAHEPTRVGSFGGAVDGGAALEGEHTLVAIVEGAHLAELDLTLGIAATRASAVASGAAYFLGPPALRSGAATFFALAPSRAFLVTIGGSGDETARVAISSPTTTLADGGAPLLVVPPHVGPIVDARGAIAFAWSDAGAYAGGGDVGLISPDGALTVLGESLCGRAPSPATNAAATAPRGQAAIFAGVAPAGPGAFVIACANGVVAKIVGGGA